MTIASIDIGTNTILMVITEYDEISGNIKTLLNEYRIPRIGKGLIPGSPISDDKILLLMDILADFKKIAENYKCKIIIATATNALRIASNKNEIVEMIKEKHNINIQVVSGEEESYLSYLGATMDSGKEDKTLVIDIGGGSTEVITGTGDNILYRKSFQTGVVSATEKYLKHDPPRQEETDSLNRHLQNIFAELVNKEFKPDKAIAIAGTPTTLVCIKQNLIEYNEDLIEGSILEKDETVKIISELSGLSSSEVREKYKSVVKGREDVLLAGSLILFHLMNKLILNEVIVSTKGIRYGAVVNYINNKFRD